MVRLTEIKCLYIQLSLFNSGLDFNVYLHFQESTVSRQCYFFHHRWVTIFLQWSLALICEIFSHGVPFKNFLIAAYSCFFWFWWGLMNFPSCYREIMPVIIARHIVRKILCLFCLILPSYFIHAFFQVQCSVVEHLNVVDFLMIQVQCCFQISRMTINFFFVSIYHHALCFWSWEECLLLILCRKRK